MGKHTKTTLVQEKAKKYLAGGQVTVTHHTSFSANINVTGSNEYSVTFDHKGWVCTCPSRANCAHIEAAKLISPLRVAKPTLAFGGATTDIFI